MITVYISLAVGGALGASLRYAISQSINASFDGEIAHVTLAVNVLGSLLIGVVFVLIHEKLHLSPSWKPLLMTGLLGSFTTFSAFSLETLTHISDGQYVHALSYVVLSLVLCIAATFLGISITRLF